MWIFTTIALIAIAGVTCFNLECIQREHGECYINELKNKLPTTIEELQEACIGMKSLLKCAHEESEKCEDNEERSKYLIDVLEYLENACYPDSRIYKAISSNLECLNSAMEIAVPACMINEENETIEEAFTERMLFRAEFTDDLSECISGLWFDACTSEVINEECGYDLADAVLDMYINIDFRLQTCGGDVTEDLNVIISAIMGIEEVE